MKLYKHCYKEELDLFLIPTIEIFFSYYSYFKAMTIAIKFLSWTLTMELFYKEYKNE